LNSNILQRPYSIEVWIRAVGDDGEEHSCFNPIKEKRDVVANTPLIEHLIKEKLHFNKIN
jgi:hypothetical protein